MVQRVMLELELRRRVRRTFVTNPGEGARRVAGYLDSENPLHAYIAFGMQSKTFIKLLELLRPRLEMEQLRMRHLGVRPEEALAIYLG